MIGWDEPSNSTGFIWHPCTHSYIDIYLYIHVSAYIWLAIIPNYNKYTTNLVDYQRMGLIIIDKMSIKKKKKSAPPLSKAQNIFIIP